MNTTNDGGPAFQDGETCKCIDCNGAGQSILPFKRLTLTCDRCNGTGVMPAIQLLWKAKGEAHRLARIARRETLRDFAKRNHMDVLVLNRAERGMINPDAMLAARDGKEGA